MVKDMTKGKPFPVILRFCIPMLFGSIFQQFYNIADTLIVGRFISVDALAAVGSTGSLNFLVIGFLLGICSGFCIPVSQSFGAGDIKEMRRYIANSLYLCAFFTVLLTVVTLLFTRQMLVLMGTPEDILEGAYSYIIVIFAGIVAIMVYNLMASILRALGDSKTPLYFLAIACVLNVALDLLFILVFGMGLGGVGLATVLAQAVSGVMCVVYVWRNYPILHFMRDELRFSWKHCKRLLVIGVPMALQFSITAVGAVILQRAVNGLGTAVIASITTGNRISMLLTQPMETLGITMATYCGQNLGAGRPDRISGGVRVAIRMTLVYSVFAGVVLWFFGRYLSLIFIDGSETEILRDMVYFLRIIGACYPVLGVLFVLRNSIQGMGNSFLPMFAGVSELVARSLVAFLLVGAIGFTAVCLAGPVAWLFADILLIPSYFVVLNKIKKAQKG